MLNKVVGSSLKFSFEYVPRRERVKAEEELGATRCAGGRIEMFKVRARFCNKHKLVDVFRRTNFKKIHKTEHDNEMSFFTYPLIGCNFTEGALVLKSLHNASQYGGTH